MDGTIAWSAARPTTVDLVNFEPRNHRDAMSCAHWHATMEEEYIAPRNNKTWCLVPPLPGMNIIDCKWVLKKTEV